MKKSSKKWYTNFSISMGLILSFLVSYVVLSAPTLSDEYIRDRVVKLAGNGYTCSGEQVRSDSGVDYVLTAAHCKELANNGKIAVITEDGKLYERKIIAEDPYSDLLLLQGVPHLEGLHLTHSSKRFQHIRTFTHGLGLKTYKTEGIIVEKQEIQMPIGVITNEEQFNRCYSMPKNKVSIEISEEGVMTIYCILISKDLYTTAVVAPGSSGGPVVNDSGELLGVVSGMTNPIKGEFSLIVDQVEINKFLRNR